MGPFFSFLCFGFFFLSSSQLNLLKRTPFTCNYIDNIRRRMTIEINNVSIYSISISISIHIYIYIYIYIYIFMSIYLLYHVHVFINFIQSTFMNPFMFLQCFLRQHTKLRINVAFRYA